MLAKDTAHVVKLGAEGNTSQLRAGWRKELWTACVCFAGGSAPYAVDSLDKMFYTSAYDVAQVVAVTCDLCVASQQSVVTGKLRTDEGRNIMRNLPTVFGGLCSTLHGIAPPQPQMRRSVLIVGNSPLMVERGSKLREVGTQVDFATPYFFDEEKGMNHECDHSIGSKEDYVNITYGSSQTLMSFCSC